MKAAHLFLILGLAWLNAANGQSLELHTRSCAESAKGSSEWRTIEKTVQWEPKQTAIVICDMWNQHWCKGATARVAEMAPQMNEVLKEARRRGILIIHCPSDTMRYYEGTPQRKLAQAAPKVNASPSLKRWGGLEPER